MGGRRGQLVRRFSTRQVDFTALGEESTTRFQRYVELRVVVDGDRRASLTVHHRHRAPGAGLNGPTRGIWFRGVVLKELQAQLGIAERLAQHDLELVLRGVFQPRRRPRRRTRARPARSWV